MPSQEDAAQRARHMYEPLECVHVAVYVAKEAAQAYLDLGLPAGFAGYFASRSAAMGAVSPAVVVATFYVFGPGLVHECLPAAWETASPARVLGARQAAVDAGLRRMLGPLIQSEGVAEAAELSRQAVAGLEAAGRPLYAAHAELPEPSEPHLALWHWATLLREHRGDGHVAALLLAGLDPVESLVMHAATGGAREFLQAKRGWSDAQWMAGERRLRERGLLAHDGTATADGADLRRHVEKQTDEAAKAPWQALGVEGSKRLRDLLQPVAAAVRAADVEGGATRRIGL